MPDDTSCRSDPTPAELLAQASDPNSTPFDYVIVGSGAGGGPLASRLALAGKRVLLLDAGCDPAQAPSRDYPGAGAGETTACPAYHAAATEDSEMSWQFSVRHYADTARQRQDEKYNVGTLNPRWIDPGPGGRSQGIFYPRSATLGGCTAHHAMIMAVPNDRDWDRIADLTGDESWRASAMRGYFARLERCLYVSTYRRWLQRLIGPLYAVWQWIVLQFDPRAVLDEGGHGTKGWQPTTLIDPQLIEGIRSKDRGFTGVLIGSALAVLHHDNRLIGMLKRALVWSRIVQHIDPNDLNTRRTSPEGVFLIPTGIESAPGPIDGVGVQGRRAGVRELVEETRKEHPDRLVVKLGVHVTRVLFAPGNERHAPRAVGVEAAEGIHLYEASPLHSQEPPSQHRVRYFAKREIVLCGGAFNTPQLLMLSGIGDAAALAGVAAQSNQCALTGVGGQPLYDGSGAPLRIDLPGVGRNLQDRYEVTVLSELDEEFVSLQGASFAPGDAQDPVRHEWRTGRGGLYATNGGTLAILRRSSALGPNDPEPDTFTFGAPAAFRGYYWGWSRELLRDRIGAADVQRNLWSWIILKAYTRNRDGYVRLHSSDPFVQPEICFDSFNEATETKARELEAAAANCRAAGRQPSAELIAELENAERALAESRRDLKSLVDTVRFIRAVNARNPDKFTREIQPGPHILDDSAELEQWIRSQAWGHHASCTARMGSDRWQRHPEHLHDRLAVLDSRFRVHGVEGLRVVDASVFPEIPGYFILTPVLMASEKAADVLLEDAGTNVYPAAFERTEAEALRRRRKKAKRRGPRHVERELAARGDGPSGDDDAGAVIAAADNAANPPCPPITESHDELPRDTVGLALSGGGIRSATFALGVLQALAARDRLRDIDFLSTVSGGGFIGGFLGRLFTRDLVGRSEDPAGRAQDVLTDGRSGPLWWLRTQANYIFANGGTDLRMNLAVLWRNIVTVHLVVGMLLFAGFGLLAWAPGALGVPPPPTLWANVTLSPWWWAPVAWIGLAVLPATVAFWLSPATGSYRPYPIFALFAWLVLVAGSLWLLQVPGSLLYAGGTLTILFLGWVWQDVARWGVPASLERDAARRERRRARRRGVGIEAAEAACREKEAAARLHLGPTVRNRLTRGLGETVAIAATLVGFVVLDTVARALVPAKGSMSPTATVAMALAALAPAMPILRTIGVGALKQVSAGGAQGFSFIRAAKTLGIPLAILLLLLIDVVAHLLFAEFPREGIWVVLLWAVLAGAIGRAFDFLNLSSLTATYGARLTRTFLGASNAARTFGAPNTDGPDVQLTHPHDDIPHDAYHPEENGGPIHLINVCINETVDAASEREIRERKGISMCVTPHGVSVGRRYFATWTEPDDRPRWQRRRRWRDGIDAEDELAVPQRRRTALKALPVGSDPNAFHVLKSRESDSAEVEPLSLGTWMAISGAAFSTGIGRDTSLPLALFMGLTNIRLGHWWDTGILTKERPGRYPLPLWRKLKRFPAQLFGMQSKLLAEWRARFRGPSEWFWYLTDGGHFEVTGLYELVRRRVGFMIVVDAGEDPDYRFADLALLTKQVRVDFGAKIEWLDAPGVTPPPPCIGKWVDTTALGPISSLCRSSPHNVALARVEYEDGHTSWLLLIKPGLAADLTQDIASYAKVNEAFPHDSTFNQVFDDDKWESYRALGEQIARRVLK